MNKRTQYLTGWLMLIGLLLLTVSSIFAQDTVPVVSTPTTDEVAEEIVDFTVETAESTASSLENFLQRLTTTPRSDIARVLLVIGGVVLLVAGWRIYDFVVIIAGFLIGASVAVSLLTTDNTLIVIAALLVGGLLGAALSAFVYYAAVFLIGAYIGVVLTSALANAFGLLPVSSLALLLGAIIGGIVLLGLSFEFLVLISSLVGAQMLSLGLGLDVTWTALFAVVGVVVQLGLMRYLRYDWRRKRRPISFWRRGTV